MKKILISTIILLSFTAISHAGNNLFSSTNEQNIGVALWYEGLASQAMTIAAECTTQSCYNDAVAIYDKNMDISNEYMGYVLWNIRLPASQNSDFQDISRLIKSK